jgi:hypothetical protein
MTQGKLGFYHKGSRTYLTATNCHRVLGDWYTWRSILALLTVEESRRTEVVTVLLSVPNSVNHSNVTSSDVAHLAIR